MAACMPPHPPTLRWKVREANVSWFFPGEISCRLAGENWSSLMIDYSVRPPNCDNHLHPYCQDTAGNEVRVHPLNYKHGQHAHMSS